MHSLTTFLALAAAVPTFSSAATYRLQDDFSGKTFFDNFDFYGKYDNLTLGDVNWVSKDVAVSKNLAEINSEGNAVMRVSTETVVWDNKRDTIRVTTSKAYLLGTIWITDVVHLPYGCSVWPAIWTVGAKGPEDGEIDIAEGINLMTNNRMSLHTKRACSQSQSVTQTGKTGRYDCNTDSGCTIDDQDTKSYGDAFNEADGGVWATEFAKDGINIWFWTRANVPSSIKDDVSSDDAITSRDDWGTPAASYPGGSDCDIGASFGPQKLIYDITLCGVWGRNPNFYLEQCPSEHKDESACYLDNVVGDGSNYKDAYMEVKYLRAYIDTNVASVSGQAQSTSSAKSKATATSGGSSSPSDSAVKSGAGSMQIVPLIMFGPLLLLCTAINFV